jgi:hypothetical protein
MSSRVGVSHTTGYNFVKILGIRGADILQWLIAGSINSIGVPAAGNASGVTVGYSDFPEPCHER